MNLIYPPKGPAEEYAPLACNYYCFCTHGCRYCYRLPFVSAQKFHQTDVPKKDAIDRLRKDSAKLQGDEREIMLCFVGDPYQPCEMDLGITRQAIEIFIEHDLHFTVLTKGGTRAVRDFDLLENYDKARFGSTIVFWEQKDANYWEPNAVTVADRISAIEQAHNRGIPTWVSLEPVINPAQALKIIQELHPIVDHWKVGKLNHHKKVEQQVNWLQFRDDVTALLNDLNADYYLKNSLTGLKKGELK
jgi:DNA repair photolyase